MSRLTRDGTVEPISRDQTLRHARGQGNINFPCSAVHEQNWQPYLVDPYSAIYVMTIHTYIHTYIKRHTGTPDKKQNENILSVHMCLIPYILAPVYAFRCIFDVSAGLWKEEKVYSITVGFSPTLYC